MLGNLILEQSATPGNLATINLSGAVTGRVTMRSQIANGAVCFYELFDATVFEVGIGTLSHGTPDTLSRTTVLYNSSGTTSRINFPGTVYVTNYIPAERAVYRDASNNLSLPAALAITGALTGSTAAFSGALTGTTASFSGAVTATPASSGNQVITWSQTAFNSANPGSVVTPRGYKRAFGSTAVTVASNLATVNFGTTFGAVHSVYACNGNMTTTLAMCGIVGFNTSALQVHVVGYSSGPYTVNWSVDGEL